MKKHLFSVFVFLFLLLSACSHTPKDPPGLGQTIYLEEIPVSMTILDCYGNKSNMFILAQISTSDPNFDGTISEISVDRFDNVAHPMDFYGIHLLKDNNTTKDKTYLFIFTSLPDVFRNQEVQISFPTLKNETTNKIYETDDRWQFTFPIGCDFQRRDCASVSESEIKYIWFYENVAHVSFKEANPLPKDFLGNIVFFAGNEQMKVNNIYQDQEGTKMYILFDQSVDIALIDSVSIGTEHFPLIDIAY